LCCHLKFRRLPPRGIDRRSFVFAHPRRIIAEKPSNQIFDLAA
jgi:hypothetical protein